MRPLLSQLRSIAIKVPGVFKEDPYEQFLEHVWVSPFFEDNVLALVERVGASNVLFGSDYPHAEGLAEPISFVDELKGLSDEDVRKIMHDNARELVTPRPV